MPAHGVTLRGQLGRINFGDTFLPRYQAYDQRDYQRLFSNQTEYIGVAPKHVPSVGDLTFEAGFVITAVIYLTWHAIEDRRHSATLTR